MGEDDAAGEWEEPGQAAVVLHCTSGQTRPRHVEDVTIVRRTGTQMVTSSGVRFPKRGRRAGGAIEYHNDGDGGVYYLLLVGPDDSRAARS